ncbi:Glycerol-3-phosphate cytidylyltransferase [Castellaniella defragrans 65Phen]|jgi:glycerol-3-phosphate cytidylyltransferase|uniref:Glycerol-3-phosphate cytidylyltransferase n=2 Tax=Castellaniella defragrans TaxID=75697 RepID=W8X9C7_CASD6|nr:adenylyltransferase/cytidyltransferase family protein [Castellaniella defragrans]KAB0622526.1 adenylyltransferase/cytidyltransferase family protein [Castellaniella defragrans]MBB6084837.1 glycerol-3-phosphate cytidylyltransferase [Castellaniella defragrans]CDM24595.1 Glycerol-3-phosphate cytidylyltransferase [Castellaniella defragrans 65Phen]
MKTVLTYGTFDLFHIGHLRLLQRLSALGDRLVVGVSTDEFNHIKGKKTVVPFSDRIEIIRALRCVDLAIPETCWEQKAEDIKTHGVAVFGMGSDWEGRFDELKAYCEVVYLPRTEGISSTHIRKTLKILDQTHIGELKQALDLISSIIDRFD